VVEISDEVVMIHPTVSSKPNGRLTSFVEMTIDVDEELNGVVTG
jgi:hypothetical protein